MTSPSAPERCNGVDDDCDGAADADDPDLRDGAPERSWLADGDGDGAGDPTATFFGCAPPPGFILAATSTGDDCDDADPTRHPVAHERCDDVDQDCDGLAWRDATVGFLPTGAQVVEDLTAEVHGPVLDPTLTLDGGVLHVCGDVLTVLSVVATAELEVVGHATHGRARVRAVDRGVWLRSASDLTLRGLEVVDSGRRDVGDGHAAVDHAPSRMVALRIADCGFRNNGDGLPTPGLGGAVATRARQVDVSDSAFTGNLAATGAGLRHLDMPAGSTVRVTNTAFELNRAADGCGAVHIDGAETVTLVGVSLISNQTDLGAGGGGCIRTPAGGAVHIEDPEIVSNIGELVGGLDVESGTIHVFGSEPVREEPPPARLVVGGDNPCDIDRDTGTAPTEIDGTGRAEVRDNAARTVDEALEDAAGGLRLRANVVEIEDVALEGNEIFTLGGAAMWIGPQEVPAVALLRRLRVADNETSASRSSITAAVRISTDVTLSLYRSEFVSNRAFGSGAAALQVDEDTRIHRTSFHANQATPRGVNSATIRYRSEGTLTLTDSAFTDNTGGAALAIKLNGGLRVHGTSFVHNTSSVGAGAIEFVKDSLSPNDISTTGTTCLQHARFVSNTTTLGGGAIHLPGTDAGLDAADIGGELEAFASVFDNNEADGPGASIFLEGNVTAALYGATFTNTPNGAAAIAVHSTERGPARLDLDGTCGFDDPTYAIQTADVDASAPIAYPYASLPVSCTSDLGCGL
jgi:hypothetical protein